MHIQEFKQYDMTASFWESPAEFGREFLRLNPHTDDAHYLQGQRDGDRVVAKRMIDGSMKGVDAARKLLEKVMQEIDIPHPSWQPARAGALPSVPDFLVGHPECMRVKTQVASDRSPLKIVVDITGSSGSFQNIMGMQINPMHARAVALLAVVLALGEVRPVQLQIISGWGGAGHHNGVTLINVPTANMDLASMANALCDYDIASPTARYCINKLGGRLGWEWGLYPEPGTEDRKEYEKRYRVINSMSPTDMYMPPLTFDDPCLKDPVGFVHRTYKQFAQTREDWES